MTSAPRESSSQEGRNGLTQQVTAALRFTLTLPFKIVGKIIQHTAQILFALFVLFLHPQAKWLLRVIAESALVRVYLKPWLRLLAKYLYEPYFVFLGRLPPYWATFSIAMPLAVLEPAKVASTVLAVARPKVGIALWLLLQAVGLVLIDRTWTAVRPQARKLRFVASAHAWLWLNAEHGKYWIIKSRLYQMAVLWAANVRRFFRELRARLLRWKAGGPS
jgi:hypothetical protein